MSWGDQITQLPLRAITTESTTLQPIKKLRVPKVGVYSSTFDA